jgi:predicted aspartyl protease
MGEVKVTIELRSLSGNGGTPQVVETLADTGATLTLLPAALLRAAGVSPETSLKLQLADGRIAERKAGHAWIAVQGQSTAVRVVFGEEGDAALLGLTVLEQLGLAVDPVKRSLIQSTFHLL